ncbi:hypothetical protein J6590_051521 [Homalodisca vitripennis]|nr:hypothetical protein J6590_051521 [Homalodisca vitripennis]
MTAEELILPVAQNMVSTMISRLQLRSFPHTTPVLNNSMERRITEMAQDIKDQLKTKLQKSEDISIQVDESTDVYESRSLATFPMINTPVGTGYLAP